MTKAKLFNSKFRLEPGPLHANSVYLQTILGDIHVSEYGSFLHKPKVM